MTELTCIVCPRSCELRIETLPDGNLSITGNACPRGATWAAQEVLDPLRTVSATCRVLLPSGGIYRLPVKTRAPCPRSRITALLADIYALTLSPPIKVGEVLIQKWRGLDIDIVACATVNKYGNSETALDPAP